MLLSMMMFSIMNMDFWKLLFISEFMMFFMISLYSNWSMYLMSLSISTFMISFCSMHMFLLNFMFIYIHKLFSIILYKWKNLFYIIYNYNFMLLYEAPYMLLMYSILTYWTMDWYMNMFLLCLLVKMTTFSKNNSYYMLLFTINHSIMFLYMFMSFPNMSMYTMFLYILPCYMYFLYCSFMKYDLFYKSFTLWPMVCGMSYGGLVMQEYMAMIMMSQVCMKCIMFMMILLYIFNSSYSSSEFYKNLYSLDLETIMIFMMNLNISMFTFIILYILYFEEYFKLKMYNKIIMNMMHFMQTCDIMIMAMYSCMTSPP